MYPVEVRGRLVTLREFRDDDAVHAFAVVGDDRVTDWLLFDSRTPDTTADMVASAVERARRHPRTEYYLAVADDADTLVGVVRLGLGGVRAAKLGYAVRADRWGRGYATDACRALVGFGFGRLGLHRITATIDPGQPRLAGGGAQARHDPRGPPARPRADRRRLARLRSVRRAGARVVTVRC